MVPVTKEDMVPVTKEDMVPVTKEDWRGIKSTGAGKPRTANPRAAAAAGPPASADPTPAVISLEELSECMHMPLKVVAQEKGICLTTLKKACRMHGIKRWPFRKLRSIERAASLEFAAELQAAAAELRHPQPSSQPSSKFAAELQAAAAELRHPQPSSQPSSSSSQPSSKPPQPSSALRSRAPPPAAAAGGPGA